MNIGTIARVLSVFQLWVDLGRTFKCSEPQFLILQNKSNEKRHDRMTLVQSHLCGVCPSPGNLPCTFSFSPLNHSTRLGAIIMSPFLGPLPTVTQLVSGRAGI